MRLAPLHEVTLVEDHVRVGDCPAVIFVGVPFGTGPRSAFMSPTPSQVSRSFCIVTKLSVGVYVGYPLAVSGIDVLKIPTDLS